MAIYATSTSTITYDAGAVAINGVFDISLNYSRTPIEVTELGNGFKNYVYGQSEATITVQGYMDGDATAQSTIVADLIAGSSKKALAFTAHTGETYSFTAVIIESIDVASVLNDVVKITLTMRACSAMTEA
jgi:hypothetical protein